VIIDLIIFVISLAVLLKSSELLIDSSTSIARSFGLTEFFIGTTLVALGTSLPELASSVMAAASNQTGIVTGNIIGSNITNLSLILGIASVMIVLSLKNEYFKKKVNILLGVSLLFYILSLDGRIGWTEGLLFLAMFAYYIVREKNEIPKESKNVEKLLKELFGKKREIHELTVEEKEILSKIDYKTYKKLVRKGIDIKKIIKKKYFLENVKLFSFSFISIIGIILGSKYLVTSTVSIATALEISTEIIAMSALAFGTSVPELAVTFSAAKKSLPNILVGNLVGSNIANILLVGGVTAMITPLTITPINIWFIMPFMILITLLFKHYLKTKWITRVFEGLILIFFYLLFLFILFLTSGMA
tara:strand:- start:1152 stop:2231 length:1080 start_codon:yes stop_codon:yes gene_type:complete